MDKNLKLKHFDAKDVFEINKIWHKYEARHYSESHHEIFVDEKLLWKKVANKYLTGTDSTLLDFGCGTGFISSTVIPFLSPSSRLIMADPSPEMLAIAQNNVRFPNVTFQLISRERSTLAIAAHSLDYILINSVLHHISDLSETFRQLTTLLKTGGKIIIAHEPNRIHFNNFFLKLLKEGIVAAQKRMRRPSKNTGSIGGSTGDKQIVAAVNQEMRLRGMITQDLQPNELQSLVDFHSPTARQRVDPSIGFSKRMLLNEFQKYGRFSVDDCKTYAFLGKIKIKRQHMFESILGACFPNSGSKLFIVMTKTE